MKKIIYSAMAVAMLATTSCKDDFAESFVGEEATVEFSISTADMNTRAYSDAGQIDHLHYAIYEEDGTITQLTAKNVDFKDRQKTLRLNLKTGKTYKAIFWADDENAPYDIDFDAKTMKIDRNSVYMKSNNDMLDAFYAVEEINVSQSATKNVVLTRPFAQINVGTNDWTKSVNANYTPTQSSMSVPVYTTLNLWNGSVADRYQVEYAYNDLPTEELKVNGQNYTYIAMNYVLVDERETIDVTFRHKDAKGVETSKTVGSVPVQRNYRTNLYGSLLTGTADINVTINPEYNEPDYNNKYEVSTATDLQDAIYDAVAAGNGVITLTADITATEIITIGTNTRSNAGTRIVLDGNGKTLKSTAGRAINVSGMDGVTIKDLTIDAKGERAINIIQNATNVTIDNVTATAANYTVNVAASAPNAVVAIKNSTLNGLCTVNVSAPKAEVTIDGSTINCNDNNTTAGESYAALCLIKEAVGGKIIATNTTVNVTEGSDSYAGRNGAEDGVVTINGSTEGVTVTVAVITYPGSNYYHGFQTLQEAIEFAKAGDTITLIRDITTSETYTIADGKNITLDLNGKTISGTDNSTGSFGLITNKGTLTIKGGNGKIQLTATQNRGWNAYSSVISNQPGGKLIVEGGTIEHLGGSDMAYGIDNLTNGKGTYAETIVNGGTIKSTYRAIRQFLNGVEAQNILIVNGGTIEGGNKSIWMQDPSKNANTGSLTVGENAQLKGDVYLFVTAGSTEWPVEVEIAKAALQGESTVVSGNVPEGYSVIEDNGTYKVVKTQN